MTNDFRRAYRNHRIIIKGTEKFIDADIYIGSGAVGFVSRVRNAGVDEESVYAECCAMVDEMASGPAKKCDHFKKDGDAPRYSKRPAA